MSKEETKQDLKTRTVLAFDLTKKDLGTRTSTTFDIINRFKAIGLWYHILVIVANGYTPIPAIEPTHDMVPSSKSVTQATSNELGDTTTRIYVYLQKKYNDRY